MAAQFVLKPATKAMFLSGVGSGLGLGAEVGSSVRVGVCVGDLSYGVFVRV